jgi:hypothetical protein
VEPDDIRDISVQIAHQMLYLVGRILVRVLAAGLPDFELLDSPVFFTAFLQKIGKRRDKRDCIVAFKRDFSL